MLGTAAAGEAERLVTGDKDLLVLGSFKGVRDPDAAGVLAERAMNLVFHQAALGDFVPDRSRWCGALAAAEAGDNNGRAVVAGAARGGDD